MTDKPVPPPPDEDVRDLGFGSVVAARKRERLLNRDGTFNVERRGLGLFASLSPYHALLTMSWSRFLALFIATYLLINTLFAAVYRACGPGALEGPPIEGQRESFLQAFFFSVETLSTIGYGHISPRGLAANIAMTVESLVGLLGFALVTGLLFARFSRPIARIIFSRQAVVAPFRGLKAFEFRIANSRSNQIIEVEVKVVFSRFETIDGKHLRRFAPLELERSRVSFFPLSWTIVHPIDEKSPLSGLTEAELRESDAEFLILLTGTDETFSQTVHARSSYKADEIVWNAKFASAFEGEGGDRPLAIDVGRLHEIERLS